MQIQEIEVLVHPDGKVKLHVRGAPGAQCLELTADLEKALGGQVLAREHTPEFDQSQAQSLGDSLHLGH
jgi:hypothetical protein